MYIYIYIYIYIIYTESNHFQSLSNPVFYPIPRNLREIRIQKHKLKYQENINTANNKKQRKRNTIWFNP